MYATIFIKEDNMDAIMNVFASSIQQSMNELSREDEDSDYIDELEYYNEEDDELFDMDVFDEEEDITELFDF